MLPSTPQDNQSERVMQAYRANQKHIKSIYRRYLSFDRAYEEADLEQEALFATYLAMVKWDPEKDRNMDFSTFLHWYVQKHFQKRFPGGDKAVDIYDAEGRLVRTIKYNTYRKCKTALKAQGQEGHVRSILVPFDPNDETSGSTLQEHDTGP
jgi:Sigma-70 region 2